jgi:hypothetical protein
MEAGGSIEFDPARHLLTIKQAPTEDVSEVAQALARASGEAHSAEFDLASPNSQPKKVGEVAMLALELADRIERTQKEFHGLQERLSPALRHESGSSTANESAHRASPSTEVGGALQRMLDAIDVLGRMIMDTRERLEL